MEVRRSGWTLEELKVVLEKDPFVVGNSVRLSDIECLAHDSFSNNVLDAVRERVNCAVSIEDGTMRRAIDDAAAKVELSPETKGCLLSLLPYAIGFIIIWYILQSIF